MNFCHIWTPRHALYPSRFTTLNMDTCFAPQWCAFFQHLNLQKWPRLEVFSAIWLGNVLQGTTACIFSTSQVPEAFQHWGALHILTWKCAPGCTRVRCSTSHLPKVVRTWCAFYMFSTHQLPNLVRTWCVLYTLIWTCASRHNGAHFCEISTSKSGPNPLVFDTFRLELCFTPQRRAIFHLSSGQLARIRRFSEPTSRPSGATHLSLEKHNVLRLSYLSPTCIFFLLTFSDFLFFDLLFSSRLFSSLTFSSDFLLCVWSLTPKLPSVKSMESSVSLGLRALHSSIIKKACSVPAWPHGWHQT